MRSRATQLAAGRREQSEAACGVRRSGGHAAALPLSSNLFTRRQTCRTRADTHCHPQRSLRRSHTRTHIIFMSYSHAAQTRSRRRSAQRAPGGRPHAASATASRPTAAARTSSRQRPSASARTPSTTAASSTRRATRAAGAAPSPSSSCSPPTHRQRARQLQTRDTDAHSTIQIPDCAPE